MFALQDLLIDGRADAVSHPVRDGSNIRYVKSRDFPSLEMPPLYLTFRFERPDLIELRRVFTEEDIRGGLHLDA